jgi:hypothetical protein
VNVPVASLVLGILGLLCMFFAVVGGSLLGVLLGLAATILGILGRKGARANNQPTGVATAGMVIGVISLGLNIIISAACAMCFKLGVDAANEMQKPDVEFQGAMNRFREQDRAIHQRAQQAAQPAPALPPAPSTPPAPPSK